MSRRLALAGAAALAAPRLVRAAPLRELVLHGPPAGPSITLAHAVAAGALSDVADKVTFRAWRNPDEMRAGLTSGTMQAVVMPTTTAANLHNRGFGLRLVNVMTNGLLHIVSADPSLTSFKALSGRRLAVPFRNDTPEFILNRILAHEGLAAGRDIVVDTTGTPVEAIQLVVAGRIDAALVPEPAASAAIVRAQAAGKRVSRVIDVQTAFRQIAGPEATLPQAGLAVTARFMADRPDLVEALHSALERTTRQVLAAPARAAGSAAAPLEMPWPVVEASIEHSNLVAIRASAARAQLETLFRTIADGNPALIGGRLPDAAFYW
ncbi:ABC transporter substrate-binding protein [Phreatobacter sp.]|uniref:ABC transporter substrate-binding protein n=1 Tax=Phreatobacter sp. TaxID=1966341 RepID=UPI0025D9209D|nr:ABC transporter substrate-binding protein [Phreatobacter sp.]